MNGKIKSRITVATDADSQQVEEIARSDEKVANAIQGRTVRVIVVKGRLVNFIAN